MGRDKNGERRPRPAVEEPVGRIVSGIQRVPAAPIKMSEKTENPQNNSGTAHLRHSAPGMERRFLIAGATLRSSSGD